MIKLWRELFVGLVHKSRSIFAAARQVASKKTTTEEERANTYDFSNHMCSTAGNGAFLHDNCHFFRILGDSTCGTFQYAQICSGSYTQTAELSKSIDADEHDIGLRNGLRHPRRKDKVGRSLVNFDGAEARQVDG